MSLILAYHNQTFGAVLCDGRVSQRLPDGSYIAVPGEVGKKFAVLKPSLVLAGSSSHSGGFDRHIFGMMQEYVRQKPDVSFDEVASVVPHTVASTKTALSAAFGLRFDETQISLMLMGDDKDRVRNRAFNFNGESCEQSEYESGCACSGFIETHEEVPRRLLDLMDEPRTVEGVTGAMLSLAAEIAATRPNTVGAPYFTEVIQRGRS